MSKILDIKGSLNVIDAMKEQGYKYWVGTIRPWIDGYTGYIELDTVYRPYNVFKTKKQALKALSKMRASFCTSTHKEILLISFLDLANMVKNGLYVGFPSG